MASFKCINAFLAVVIATIISVENSNANGMFDLTIFYMLLCIKFQKLLEILLIIFV